MKTSLSTSIIVYLLVLLPFVFCVLSFSDISNRGAIGWFLLILYFLIIILDIDVLKKDHTSMIAFTIVYAIMQLLYILFSRSLPEFYKPYNKLYYFLFAFSGLCFWVLGYRKITIQQKQLLWVQNVFLLLMCILTAMELSTINIVNAFGTNDEKFLFLYQNLSYILLWLFIPLYMNDNTYIRWGIGMIMIVLLVLLLKRGPLVALALSVILIYLTKRKKLETKYVVLFTVFALIFVFSPLLLDDSFDFLLERFQGADETDGDISNHRFSMWEIFISKWITGNSATLLLGNGFESSHIIMYRAVANAKGAHNDFLELLYCNGILGLLIFSFLVYQYYKIMRLAIKIRYKYKDLLIISFVFFFCSSIYSSNLTRFPTVFFGMYFYYFAGAMQRYIDSHKDCNKLSKTNFIVKTE